LFYGEFSPFCEKYFGKKKICLKFPAFWRKKYQKNKNKNKNCQNHLKYEKGA
jgi:hypothetical protein